MYWPDGLVGGVWSGVVNARGCLVGWVGVEIVLSSWEGFFVFHVNAVFVSVLIGCLGEPVRRYELSQLGWLI